jgi:Amt family ammonium transporter
MMDIMWILSASALVFIMQAGFVCLESGLVRSKNSINVAAKNFMDICVSGLLFWLFGYAVMFGPSIEGWYGAGTLLFGHNEKPLTLAFFLFQMMFCGTATTIISGAVAERMNFKGYMFVSAIMASLIYPFVGHWAWAGALEGKFTGWLGDSGFIDFAGSTVVHSVGGWVSLAAIIIIGPRMGRFTESTNKIHPSNLPLSVLGAMLLWFGWFGFNGGSTLAMNSSVPLILVNTCLAAMAGGISALSLKWMLSRIIVVTSAINGVLGGLVGITASCHIVSPGSAVIIGLVAGIIVVLGSSLLERLEIDDAVDAVPVHLFSGIWGTLAVALFFEPGASQLSHWEQLNIQIVGIAMAGSYAFGLSFTLLYLTHQLFSIRVNAEAERVGLNISEHSAATEILDLLTAMELQKQQGDFSQPVEVEVFTEIGQIAQQYNYVLGRVNQEIQQRESALHAFHSSEKRKGAIFNSSLDCIITIDRNGLILEFNPAAEKCFGYSYLKMRGRNFIDYLVPEKDRLQFSQHLIHGFAMHEGPVLNRLNQVILQRLQNMEFPAEIIITRVSVEKQSGNAEEYTFTIRDITRQLKMQNEMRRMAFNDELTGLYNRRFFIDRLKQEIHHVRKHNSCLVLLFLDLDQFKDINDSLGHKAGDQVLCTVAERLNSTVREKDMVCRWGGDEFVIMMSGLEEHSVICRKADDLLGTMRVPFIVNDQELIILASIGIAVYAAIDEEIDADKLIQHADMAMYHAKSAGKDVYSFFIPAMEETANRRFYYETETRKALKENQFFLEYQPKVCCRSGEIMGFEALLRWRHPQEDLISPSQFIPILENSNLIIEVSNWVLENVCQQIKMWQVQGLPVLPVAVNISGKHFLIGDFYEQVAILLGKTNLSGEYLEFEITETVLAKDTLSCLEIMKKLKQLTIKFSIDDFGTGYSSMSYIKKFPVDTLKIDRIFVSECDTNKEDAAICTAIIVLGKSLGLKVVAEGVETKVQLDFLQQKGCDIYQGFFYSKPLTAGEIEKLLKDNYNYSQQKLSQDQ